MKKLFTKEQEDFILENYETMKYKDIGKKIGDFTALQICSWINAHKDKIKNTSIFTEKDIDFIKKNYKNLSYKEIANILGYTERQVRGKINNIVVKKTYSTTFPKVPDNLFFDFLRGYIDGDGYISNNNGYIHVGLVSHNNEILKYIQDKLLEYNIHSKIYLEERNNSHIYRFRCFKVEDVKKLLNHLYEDVNSQKLERKYEKYKSFYEGSPS